MVVAAASPDAAPDKVIRAAKAILATTVGVGDGAVLDIAAGHLWLRVVPISPESQNLLAPSEPCSTAVAVLGLSPALSPALSPVASTSAPEGLVSLPHCLPEGLVSPKGLLPM